LNALKNLCQEHKVGALAIPRIGCGLDGLLWSQVKAIIKEVFEDMAIEVTVYRLE
jgi:hypothetical protein